MFPVCFVTYVAGLHSEGGAAPAAHPSGRTEGEYSFHSEAIELPEHSDENEGIDPRLAHSRWRSFSRQWIAEHKGDSLDISWLKDSDSVDAANLPEPSTLALQMKEELDTALLDLGKLLMALDGEHTHE